MESLSLNQSLWIFGYGSLIWNPGFAFSTSRKAYAIGWARRMYQGNTYHRGDEKLVCNYFVKYRKPGAVVPRSRGLVSQQPFFRIVVALMHTQNTYGGREGSLLSSFFLVLGGK